MNYHFINIYYYYLCSFIFKGDLSIYNNKDIFNLLYNDIYYNFIRSNLIRIKRINCALQKKMKKYLIQLNKSFQKLNLYVHLKKKRLKYIKLENMFYRKMINISKNLLYKNIFLLYKRFRLYSIFKKLFKFAYAVSSLFVNTNLIQRCKQNNLFYALLYIGLQHSYSDNPFYFYSNRLLYQYNNLLLDNRLANTSNIETEIRKKKIKNIIEGSNFIKHLTSKFNKGKLCLYLLFRSSKSNNRVTIILNGKMFCDISCGVFGYKKSSRSSYLAANQLAYATSKIINKIICKFLLIKILNNNSTFFKKSIKKNFKVNRNQFNSKLQEYTTKQVVKHTSKDTNKYASAYTCLQSQPKKLICIDDSIEYLINSLIKESSLGKSSFDFSILNRFKKYKLNSMFSDDIGKIKMVIRRYLNVLINNHKCFSFKRLYHSRNKIHFKSKTSTYANVIPDFKIYLDYTGFGLGRKAAFKPINSSIYFLSKYLKDKRWRENKRKLNSLTRRTFSLKKRKRKKALKKKFKNKFNLSKKRNLHIINMKNNMNESLSDDKAVQYGINSKKELDILLISLKNHVVHLSNILHIIKDLKYFNFLKYFMYELSSKCIVSKYVYTISLYKTFDWYQQSSGFYNLNFYNLIIDSSIVQPIQNSQKNDFRYFNFIKLALKILYHLYFCNILFEFISIKKVSNVLISGIFNYFTYLFSNLVTLFKFFFMSSSFYPENAFIESKKYNVLTFSFCKNYLKVLLSKDTQYTLFTAKLYKLYYNFSELIISYLEKVNQLRIIILDSINFYSKLLNKLLYEIKFSDSLYINIRPSSPKIIPYNIRNIINMLPKNISNPHNGCRPRRLRRK